MEIGKHRIFELTAMSCLFRSYGYYITYILRASEKAGNVREWGARTRVRGVDISSPSLSVGVEGSPPPFRWNELIWSWHTRIHLSSVLPRGLWSGWMKLWENSSAVHHTDNQPTKSSCAHTGLETGNWTETPSERETENQPDFFLACLKTRKYSIFSTLKHSTAIHQFDIVLYYE